MSQNDDFCETPKFAKMAPISCSVGRFGPPRCLKVSKGPLDSKKLIWGHLRPPHHVLKWAGRRPWAAAALDLHFALFRGFRYNTVQNRHQTPRPGPKSLPGCLPGPLGCFRCAGGPVWPLGPIVRARLQICVFWPFQLKTSIQVPDRSNQRMCRIFVRNGPKSVPTALEQTFRPLRAYITWVFEMGSWFGF